MPHLDAGSRAGKLHSLACCRRCQCTFSTTTRTSVVANPLAALSIDCRNGRVCVVLREQPPAAGGQLGAPVMIAAVGEPMRKHKAPDQGAAVACVCGQTEGELRCCWGCRAWRCPVCSTDDGSFKPGVFNCLYCLSEVHEEGPWDFTADTELMIYVATGRLPDDLPVAKAQRLIAAGEHLVWEPERLWFCVEDWERQVPARWHRCGLEEEVQASLGYPGGRRVYALLRVKWYWPCMVSDCVQWCSATIPYALEHAQFKNPLYLFPTRKDICPLHAWCIDLVTGLKYPDGSVGVGSVLAVAIDAFSKWVEACMVPSKSSADIVTWFYRDIVCHFGTPVCVRSDHGTEFQGAFIDYLHRMGIQHRLISVAHPRANGLVERYNGVIRRGLRK